MVRILPPGLIMPDRRPLPLWLQFPQQSPWLLLLRPDLYPFHRDRRYYFVIQLFIQIGQCRCSLKFFHRGMAVFSDHRSIIEITSIFPTPDQMQCLFSPFVLLYHSLEKNKIYDFLLNFHRLNSSIVAYGLILTFWVYLSNSL